MVHFTKLLLLQVLLKQDLILSLRMNETEKQLIVNLQPPTEKVAESFQSKQKQLSLVKDSHRLSLS